MAYLTLEEARALTRLPVHLVADDKLALMNESSALLIDSYMKKTFSDPVPALVKLVSVELMVYLSRDKTYQYEGNVDYSYRINDKALQVILQKLDILGLAGDGKPVSGNVKASWL